MNTQREHELKNMFKYSNTVSLTVVESNGESFEVECTNFDEAKDYINFYSIECEVFF